MQKPQGREKYGFLLKAIHRSEAAYLQQPSHDLMFFPYSCPRPPAQRGICSLLYQVLVSSEGRGFCKLLAAGWRRQSRAEPLLSLLQRVMQPLPALRPRNSSAALAPGQPAINTSPPSHRPTQARVSQGNLAHKYTAKS